MKKKILGLSLLVTVCLGLAKTVSAEESVTVNDGNEISTSEVVGSETTSTSASQATSQTSEQIISSSNEVESTESTENTENTENTESEEAAPVVESQIDTAEGTMMLPKGRSDLAPSIQLFSAIPTVPVTNTNTPSKSFIDISSHNGNISVANFQKIKSYGITGVVVKLTEATSYINPYAQAQINNAKAAGLKVSAYHYSWFVNDAQAVAEANYFSAAARRFGLDNSTVMVNDIEEPQIAGKGNHTNNSKAFENRLKALGFGNVRHYIGLNWINSGRINAATLGNKNIWVAAYPYNLSTQNFYTQYGAWQWSSQLTFPGISGNFDINADYTGMFSNPAPKPPSNNSIPMYRLYNPNNYEHFYTANLNEKNHLVKIGWGRYEGIAWNAPSTGAPVYRLYNSTLRDHHYTLDWNEVKVLTTKHKWTYEGIAWYSDNNKSVKIHRLFNPGLRSGSHHYTKDQNEVNVLRTRGWKYEGIGWYAK
ncbi:GH25 family lysozyme [Enterococcus devriesei]|uniref:DUF5648 domain-containing protein n=1 Tax=Enterococcus devriesei TaxID=319970 RepID=A0A1L8STK6_9ENTE|nr:GH25 family lysozyme [Enterococcus devriesei]OJG35192.1 hypothetical protein RV00_GL003023 [Enterococcus devriesei]